MKKILIFVANLLFCIGIADAAVRDGTAISREKSVGHAVQSRVATSVPRTNVRTGTLVPRAITTVSRSATPKQVAARSASSVKRGAGANNVLNARAGQVVVSRVASGDASVISETRTGAEYEQCKNAYFACMDQFCSLKNDDYRRCSCNDRVFELAQLRETLQSAGEDLTVFNENLDVVGMTAAQATAMRKESEGEHALTSDNSASKALLQAIMNSIRGTDAAVGGKYTDLNSINISFDTANAFGMTDVGQAIGSYNGQALYSAVYPQCREAVRNDCTDAGLQRAITAYLMAVEQDCNTVQSAIAETQKQMKAAVRESNAMLDLARIENRQKHNSSDITTCINEVESAILSEEVCGANYHKCLDNGEYIDITTGKPIAGVSDFYKLEKMLTFADGVDMANQKLSKITNNRMFVQNFESRVKKFAQPALDKCVEKADVVWSEYLDKAMLSIFYAQRDKVSEIKQGCFDYVSSCYMNTEGAVDAAMDGLDADNKVVLQPNKIALNSQICNDYIASCNNMFDQDIIVEYIKQVQSEDTLTACRAVVQQCFDKYGGTNYENFYYPFSGLFKQGEAADWFSLYEYDEDGNPKDGYVSECAKQLATIDACNDEQIIERAFGGFDRINNVVWVQPEGVYPLYFVPNGEGDTGLNCKELQNYENNLTDSNLCVKQGKAYGLLGNVKEVWSDKIQTNVNKELGFELTKNVSEYAVSALRHRSLRTTGVATEVYNKIVSMLITQCTNLYGRFMPWQLVNPVQYNVSKDLCLMVSLGDDASASLGQGDPAPLGQEEPAPHGQEEPRYSLMGATGTGQQMQMNNMYQLGKNEDICPRDYADSVDTLSWGVCSCWENGARRSKGGTTTRCQAVLPTTRSDAKDSECGENDSVPIDNVEYGADAWCTASLVSTNYGSVCPLPMSGVYGYEVVDKDGYCAKKIKVDTDTFEYELLQSLPHSIEAEM